MLLNAEFGRIPFRIPLFEHLLVCLWAAMQPWNGVKGKRLRDRLRGRTSLAAGRNRFTVPDRVTLVTQTETVFFKIDKARRILGYEPQIPFSQRIDLWENGWGLRTSSFRIAKHFGARWNTCRYP